MSNFLAIATVTATLMRILEHGVGSDVPGVMVTAQPLDTITFNSDGLNLFLYQVTWNNGYNNRDVPTRNSSGEVISKPVLGLNLHYLLTAYGSGNDDLQTQAILASAMRVLYENPVITRQSIDETVNNQPGLATSDLTNQTELVKLVHQPLSIEEITKIWSSFFQIHYRISVCYEATVILLDSDKKSISSLPVTDRMVYVIPFEHLSIEKIEPLVVRPTNNPTIKIIGSNLKSDSVVVQFGNIVAAPKLEDINHDYISVSVPSNLSAGIKPVQVIHNIRFGSRPEPYNIFKSNVAPFVLAPNIINISSSTIVQGATLSVEIEPAIEPHQKVEILIGDYSIPVPPLVGEQPSNNVSVRVPIDLLAEGQQEKEFLLRIRVDGAESFLETNNEKKFVGPMVKVTAS